MGACLRGKVELSISRHFRANKGGNFKDEAGAAAALTSCV
jgi:hypothetical protein